MNISAQDVINALFSPDDIVCLRVFDDRKEGIFTGAKLNVEAGKFFSIENQLKEHNQKHRGIFFVVNSGGHTDKEITRINAQFVEMDDKSFEEQQKLIDNFPLPPSMVTPAEYPAVPEMPSGDGIKSLLLHAVWLGAGTKSLSKENLIDYRDDDKKCGYCRCILGKCKVSDMLAQLVILNAQIEEYNETIDNLNNKIDSLQLKIDDMTGDILQVGQCGDDIYYVLYSDGKLLLRGTGETYDYGTAIPISDCHYPDIDGDGRVTASDSSLILAAAANIGSGHESGLTPEQEVLADVNRDGSINAVDSSLVLSFAASAGAGNYQNSPEGWIDFLTDQRANSNLSPFFDNQNVKSLVVSDGITSLGTFAFNYCNALKSTSLSNSLTKIGRNAFAVLATDVYGFT